MEHDNEHNRPAVRCPYCAESFSAEDLPRRSLGRSELGIGIFTCPHCNRQIKVEPAEYILAAKQIQDGEIPHDVSIGAYEIDQLTPSEELALRDRAPKRYVPLAMGFVGLALAAMFLFGFSGWWRYIPAAAFLAYSGYSFKVTLFASATEVRAHTGG